MILTVHTKPGARENRIEAVLDETTVKIAVCEPAKEGKANQELIAFLAKTLQVPKSTIEIIRGTTTRIKHVNIAQIAEKTAFELFQNP